VIVLIGGGIGIVPLLSIWKEFLYLRNDEHLYMKKLFFIWTTHDIRDAKAFYDEEFSKVILNPHNNKKKKNRLKHMITATGIGGRRARTSGITEEIRGAEETNANTNTTNLDTINEEEEEEEDLVNYQFFLSSYSDPAQLEQDRDEYNLTPVEYWIAGRPVWETVFGNITSYCQRKDYQHVGIYLSAPEKMKVEVRNKYNQIKYPNSQNTDSNTNRNKISYDCHEFPFEF